MGKARARLLLSILVAGCFAGRLAAQTQTTGAIAGWVRYDVGTPEAPGVVTPAVLAAVVATGPLATTRTAWTDASGAFHLVALPPGTYRLSVNAREVSMSREASCIVALGTTTVIEFMLPPGMIDWGDFPVTVVPFVDRRSTAVATTVDVQPYFGLPLPRESTAVALLLPGVSKDGAGLSVSGASGRELSSFLDGIDVTGLRGGARGAAVPQELVEAVQVETASFPAEYGRALGGVVNAITRSGDQVLRGQAFGYAADPGLAAHAQPVVGTAFAGSTEQDFGARLGGHVVRDRLWFWSAYDRARARRDLRLATGSGSSADGTGFRAEDRWQEVYAGKLTWSLTPSTLLVSSAVGSRSRDAQQLAEDAPPSTRRLQESAGLPDGSLLATVAGSRVVAELGLFIHREKLDRTPDLAPPFLTADAAQVPTLDLAHCSLPGCLTGAPWIFLPRGDLPLLRADDRRRQGRGAATAELGPHQMKAGVDLAELSGNARQAIPGGYRRTLSRAADGRLLYTQSWFGDPSGQFGAGHVVPAVSAAPKGENLAVFLQDTWAPSPNLTVNAGLRYDRFRLADTGTGGSLADLAAGWAPRLGVAWVPDAYAASQVNLAYGRFSAAPPLDAQAGVFRGSRLAVTDLAGYTFDCGPTALACESSPGRAGKPADPDLGAPESEEWTLGYRRILTLQLTLGAHLVYSRLVRGLADRCDLPGDAGCGLVNPGSGELGRGLPAARRVYHALILSAENRFREDSYLLASYVYSSLRGNYDGPSGGGFDDPGLLPGGPGRLANDRPHQVKLAGFHRFVSGLVVGIVAYYQSGTPEDRIGLAWSNGAFVPFYFAPRGSQGRTPANSDFDLRLDYPLPLRRAQADLIVDLFRVLDRQTVLRTDSVYDFGGLPSGSASETNPHYGAPLVRAAPRRLRVGLKLTF